MKHRFMNSIARTRTQSFRIASAAVAASLCALAPCAFAQTGSDAAARRELLDQAQQARVANDHARALDLSLRASRIQMTPSLRMFIAEEQAATGLVADALNNAEVCVHEAERDTGSRIREVVMTTCQTLANTVRPRVARITVQTPQPAPAGLHITVGGHDLNDAFFGVPYIVNPGNVVIEAVAPGYQSVHREVSLASGAAADVPLALVRIETGPVVGASGEPSSGRPTATVTASIAPVAQHPVEQHPSRGPGAAPWIVMGAGIVLLGVSAGFYFGGRAPALEELRQSCNVDLSCPPTEMRAFERAQTFTTLSGVTVGVGAAAVAGGLIWFLAAPRSSPREHAQLGIVPTPGGAMLSVGGVM